MPINYENTMGLKRPHQKREWSYEEQVEFMKCAQDVQYFCENYYYIVHPIEGRMIIELYDFQKDMLRNFQKNRFNIVLSARQAGKTTVSAIYLLWFALFNPDKKIAILANKQATSAKIIADIKTAYLEIPEFLKPGVVKWDTLTIGFDTGTSIFASATSEDAIRGQAISLLFLDEFAFVPENTADSFWASNFPTLSTGGACIIVSTPNGAAGLYYDIWRKANLPPTHELKSPFFPIRVGWWQVPGRDEQWKKETIAAIGKVKFAQEHQCSFTGSSHTLIDGDVLEKLMGKEAIITPEEGYLIWKKPEPGRLYLISVDVAKGSNSDYHVINIFDVTQYFMNGRFEQVAMFRRNDIDLFSFIEKIKKVASQWGDPPMIVENNNLGSVVCSELFEYEYEHLFFDYDKNEYGVNANIKTKPLACTYLKQDIEEDKMVINSDILVGELGFFEEVRKGVFEARKGSNFHDDAVTTCYWASYCLRSKFFEDFLYYFKQNNPNSKINMSNSNMEELQDEDIMDSFFGGMGDDDLDSFQRGLGKI